MKTNQFRYFLAKDLLPCLAFSQWKMILGHIARCMNPMVSEMGQN